jgi:transcriptional regulator GlxA family with amidase domain
LQEVAVCGIQIGGLGSAVPLLARCGLLDGYRCSVASRQAGPLRERFPAVDVNTKVFTIDGDRFSCAGGSSSIDMMLNVLVDEVGFEQVASVAETLGCERIRSHVDDQQCSGMDSEQGSSVLNEAIALMRNNMDDPVSISEIARYTERSRRQIERLFKKHLGCNPSRYYMNIRLNHARQMLLNTAYSIKEIGAFCGFISIPYFSKCFREQHGATPSAIRFDRDPVNKIPYYLLNTAAVGLSYGMEIPKGVSANYIRDSVAA